MNYERIGDKLPEPSRNGHENIGNIDVICNIAEQHLPQTNLYKCEYNGECQNQWYIGRMTFCKREVHRMFKLIERRN